MKNPNSVRCTFTLPKGLYANLDIVARGLGVTRSALLVNMLSDAVGHMAEAIKYFEARGGSADAALRLRGESVEKVEALYREFMESVEKQS